MSTKAYYPRAEIGPGKVGFAKTRSIIEAPFYGNNVIKVNSLREAYDLAKNSPGTVVTDMPVYRGEEFGLEPDAKVLLFNDGSITGRYAPARRITGKPGVNTTALDKILMDAVYDTRWKTMYHAEVFIGLDPEFMVKAHLLIPEGEENLLYNWMLNFQYQSDEYVKMYKASRPVGDGKEPDIRAISHVAHLLDRVSILCPDRHKVREAFALLQPHVGTLLREKKKDIFGNITEISDETTRGIRIVIKLKRGEDAVKILDALYKHTDLQSTFNLNMVAIADGKPRLMGLQKVLEYYLNYQKQIVKNRSVYELGVAKKRAEILEGYLIVIPDIDEVIALIRSSANRTEAKGRLRERYSLSEVQAEAILSLQLGNINKLDVGKYTDELKGLKNDIERLTKIKDSVREQTAVVRRELQEIRDRYKNEANARRLTKIIGDVKDIETKPFDPTKRTAKRMIAGITADGGVKFMTGRSYLGANREAGAGGIQSVHTVLEELAPGHMALVFGSLGNCYKIDPTSVRDRQWTEKGEQLSDIVGEAPADERAVALIPFDPENIPTSEIFVYTMYGMVKRSSFSSMVIGKSFYQGMTLKGDDRVIGAEVVVPNTTILFVSSDGQCVNSLTDDYPEQGRIAGGVIGMNLNDGCKVVFAGQADCEIVDRDDGEVPMPLGEILVITEKGTGKRVIASEFPPMKRNRKGLRIIDLNGENVSVTFADKVLEPYKIVIEDADGELHAVDTEDIRIEKKDTKGKPVLRGIRTKRVFKAEEEYENG